MEANIIESFPFDSTTIDELKEEYDIISDSYSEILKEAYLNDEYSFKNHLDDWNEFSVNTIKIIGINNIEKEITYNGIFYGKLPYLDMIDFEVISKIQFLVIINDLVFYKKILAECFDPYKTRVIF